MGVQDAECRCGNKLELILRQSAEVKLDMADTEEGLEEAGHRKNWTGTHGIKNNSLSTRPMAAEVELQ